MYTYNDDDNALNNEYTNETRGMKISKKHFNKFAFIVF